MVFDSVIVEKQAVLDRVAVIPSLGLEIVDFISQAGDISPPASQGISEVRVVLEIAAHPFAPAFGVLGAELDVMFPQKVFGIIGHVCLDGLTVGLLSLDIRKIPSNPVLCVPLPPVDVAGMA